MLGSWVVGTWNGKECKPHPPGGPGSTRRQGHLGHHRLLGSNCGLRVSAPVSAQASRAMTERIHVKGDRDLTRVLDRPLNQNERTRETPTPAR